MQIFSTLAFAAAVLSVMALPVHAQNLSLSAPGWAQALVAADVIPTTGGRAVLAAEGVDFAARLTIAPASGGVARVIRYEARESTGAIHLRRLTGHASTGWWLWGSDAPLVTPVGARERRALNDLIRDAMRADDEEGARCAGGEMAYLELVSGGRSRPVSRACVSGAEAAGRLALRLSELAGWRSEEELAAAAIAEVMDADRAFSAMAQAEGVAAAFAHYASEDALIVTSRSIAAGRDAIVARYAQWPEGARLEWAPAHARVSQRGDMAWTWGNSIYVAPDGQRTPGRYVSVWARDYDGRWRYALDAPID